MGNSVSSETSSAFHLPLSWAVGGQGAAEMQRIALPISRSKWIYAAEIPFDATTELDTQLLASLPERAVIRGCGQFLTQRLQTAGWDALQVGVEAILDVSAKTWQKRSLRELARRGKRHGKILEVAPSAATSAKFCELLKASRHGREPQLRFLFRNRPWPKMRCFCFCDEDGNWLGAITLSRPGPNMFHTEVLLKHRDAPAGIMEALICHTAEHLQREGVRYLNLGEVPFVGPDELPNLKSKAFFKIGQSLRFAYDYQGLFNFKQKFSPDWQPIYLCARTGVSWRLLLDLFIASRYLHLVGYRLFRSVKSG